MQDGFISSLLFFQTDYSLLLVGEVGEVWAFELLGDGRSDVHDCYWELFLAAGTLRPRRSLHLLQNMCQFRHASGNWGCPTATS